MNTKGMGATHEVSGKRESLKALEKRKRTKMSGKEEVRRKAREDEYETIKERMNTKRHGSEPLQGRP